MNKEYLKVIKSALVQTKDDFVENMKKLKQNLNEIHQSNIEVHVIKNDELQRLLYELDDTKGVEAHELTNTNATCLKKIIKDYGINECDVECLMALAEIEHGLEIIKKHVD